MAINGINLSGECSYPDYNKRGFEIIHKKTSNRLNLIIVDKDRLDPATPLGRAKNTTFTLLFTFALSKAISIISTALFPAYFFL
ncbi:MAG: hypothetical protein V3U20_01260 [Thermoplasmata archaeon]